MLAFVTILSQLITCIALDKEWAVLFGDKHNNYDKGLAFDPLSAQLLALSESEYNYQITSFRPDGTHSRVFDSKANGMKLLLGGFAAAQGQVYVSGDLWDSNAMFLAKHDADGTKRWNVSVSIPASTSGGPIAPYGEHVFVAATFWAPGDLPGAQGGSDMAVIKYNANDGTVVWTQLLGSSGEDSASAISADRTAEQVYACSLNPGAYHLQNYLSTLYALSPVTGDVIWSQPIGAVRINAMAADQQAVYVGGFMTREFDGQVNTGERSMVLVKYASDGRKQWSRVAVGYIADLRISPLTHLLHSTGSSLMAFDSSGHAVGTAVAMGKEAHLAVDEEGSVYVSMDHTGDYEGQRALGNIDGLVVKYSDRHRGAAAAGGDL